MTEFLQSICQDKTLEKSVSTQERDLQISASFDSSKQPLNSLESNIRSATKDESKMEKLIRHQQNVNDSRLSNFQDKNLEKSILATENAEKSSEFSQETPSQQSNSSKQNYLPSRNEIHSIDLQIKQFRNVQNVQKDNKNDKKRRNGGKGHRKKRRRRGQKKVYLKSAPLDGYCEEKEKRKEKLPTRIVNSLEFNKMMMMTDMDNRTGAANINNNNANNNNGNSSMMNEGDKKSDDRNRNANAVRGRRRSRSPIDRNNHRPESKVSRRVYVANVAFDVKWSDLKDLFREKVGNVVYCQLFEDEKGQSRGCGLVEFTDAASAKIAIDTLHRFNFRNRELVVKEDLDCERDQYGRLILPSNKREKERDRDNRDRDMMYDRPGYSMNSGANYTTYGLSPQFLESLGITGPLNNRIFVANLDFKVGEKKLEEIFRLAGKVLRVRLYTDSNGTSKGHGTVEFEHPVEAVQAISMFHNQKLYGRPMSIRMDKYECEEMPEVLPSKLPAGLEGVGKGLGIGGQPLNISKSLLNSSIGAAAVAVPPVQPPPQQPIPPSNPAMNTFGSLAANIAGNLSQMPLSQQGLAPMPTSQAVSAAPASYGIPGVVNPGERSMGNLGPQQNFPVGSTTAAAGLGGLPPSTQNLLAAAASVGNSAIPGVNPALGIGAGPQAPNTVNTGNPSNLPAYNSFIEREFHEEKYRPPQVATDTVVVRNLPINFSWQNLRDRFHEIGEIRYAELKNRGQAIVRYHSERDAQRAIDLMNGMRIDNRVIEVSPYY